MRSDKNQARAGLRQAEEAERHRRLATEAALRRMASLIELSFEPIFVWHRERGIVEWNRGAAELYGYSRGEALGRVSHRLLRSEHALPLAELLDVLRNAKSWTGEVRHRAKNGQVLVVESRHQLIESEGETLILETNRDITDRKQAEANLARMAAVAAASHDALYGADLNGIIEAWNPSAERLFGYTAEEAIGRHMRLIAEPERRAEQMDFLARVGRGETVGPRDTRRRRKDGKILDVSLAMAPVKAPDGSIVAVSAACHDISERKEWEARQKLMTRELAHRVKNSLAVLLAILRSTLNASRDPEDFAVAFTGRLHSLSAAQDILIDSDWRGAELGALARHLLKSYAPRDGSQLDIAGPPMILRPENAAPFALLLNELATNALKFGALSVPEGKVSVTWRIEPAEDGGAKLILAWRETGGPPVKPIRKAGFGTRLIEQGIPGARVDCDFRPEGLNCLLELMFPRIPASPSGRLDDFRESLEPF